MLITLIFLLIVILSCCSPYIRRWAETRAKKDFPLQPGEESEVFEKPEWEPLPDTGETVPEMLFREMDADFPVVESEVVDETLHNTVLDMLAARSEIDCSRMSDGEDVAFVFLSPVSERWVRLTPDKDRRLALAARWEEALRGKNLHMWVLQRDTPENDEDRAIIADLLEAQNAAAEGGQPLELFALAARAVAEDVCGKSNEYRCVAVTWQGPVKDNGHLSPIMYILAEKVQG